MILSSTISKDRIVIEYVFLISIKEETFIKKILSRVERNLEIRIENV